MTEPTTISSTNASFPEYLDFQKLRQAGIGQCQELGRDLWTDFNLHDPGLTILEVLCYALTDLGYRTNLPIEDLLARKPNESDRKKKKHDDNFFTPAEILTCNPVSILDIRKLLIDIEGVRNAWIKPAEESEQSIYLGKDDDEIPRLHLDEEKNDPEVKLSGLYQVWLELDDRNTSQHRQQEQKEIRDVATKVLNRHRNLCEDYLPVQIVDTQNIKLKIDIEIDALANPPDVMQAMYRSIDELLSPTIKFYSLQEMLDKGKRIEEIFAGRPLTPHDDKDESTQSHGFIDTDELAKTEPRSKLLASDLYQVILGVDGVVAVRNLAMEIVETGKSDEWSLDVDVASRQLFDLANSEISFYKGQLPPTELDATAIEEVLQRDKEEKNALAKAPLEASQLDRPIPAGTHREDLMDYRSIVHEFPLVYGIGDGGVVESAPAKRKAQVHQLRGYLLFFDQILANYLAQLANVRELFSMQSHQRNSGDCKTSEGQCETTDKKTQNVALKKPRTYFAQKLTDIPEIRELLRNYNACNAEEGYPVVPENYPDYLEYITEGKEEYIERRNHFLDHLLARFAESFTDYSLLMFDIKASKKNDAGKKEYAISARDRIDIINDKTSFLESYPKTSRNRGKGFDYTNSSQWNSDNVSGLESRVRRLLGIHPTCLGELAGERKPRGTLAPIDVRVVEEKFVWSFDLSLEDGTEDRTLTSRQRYSKVEEKEEGKAEQAFADFLEAAKDEGNYRRLTYSKNDQDSDGNSQEYGFVVVDQNQSILMDINKPWEHQEDRDRYLLRLIQIANGTNIKSEVIVKNNSESRNAFHVEVQDLATSQTLLVGTKCFDTKAEANKHILKIKKWLRDPERFRITSHPVFHHENSSCYEVELLDKSNQIVARDPKHYTSEELARETIQLIYELSMDSCDADDFIKPMEWFHLNHREETFLASTQAFKSRQKADLILQAVDRLGRDRKNYQPIDNECSYTFAIIDGEGSQLAKHPDDYSTERERDQAIDQTLYLFEKDAFREPAWFRGNFFFEVTDAQGEALIQSVGPGWDKLEDVQREFKRFRALVIHDDANEPSDRNFVRDYNNETCEYSFRVVDEGSTIAASPDVYKHPRGRDEHLDHVIKTMSDAAIKHELKPCYFFRLEAGREFTSLSSFAKKSDAETACAQLLAGLNDMSVDQLQELLVLDTDRPDYHVTEKSKKNPLGEFEALIEAASRPLEMPKPAIGFGIPDEDNGKVDAGKKFHRCVLTSLHEPPGTQDGEALLTSNVFANEEEAEKACVPLLDAILDDNKYRLFQCPDQCLFGFEVVDEGKGIIARPPTLFASAKKRSEWIDAVKNIADTEGFHIVEHILLRPRNVRFTDLLPVRQVVKEKPESEEQGDDDERTTEAKKSLSTVAADNYSFVASVVVPYWPQRFVASNFQTFFEQTLLREAPAHVLLRILWVNVASMRKFETDFHNWLDALSQKDIHDPVFIEANNALAKTVGELKSVYDYGRLSGIEGENDAEPSFVIGQTSLAGKGRRQ